MLKHILIDLRVILYKNIWEHVEENTCSSMQIRKIVDRYVSNIDNITPTQILHFVPEEFSFTPNQISQLKSKKEKE